MIDRAEFLEALSSVTSFKGNPYHPLLWINGDPEIGENVSIGGFSEINAKASSVKIGDGCDIASFVVINCADSHLRCIGEADTIARRPIVIEDRVFIGSHSVVKGGAHIGHNTVVAAGTIVDPGYIPPYSLVFGNPMKMKPGYYRSAKKSGS